MRDPLLPEAVAPEAGGRLRLQTANGGAATGQPAHGSARPLSHAIQWGSRSCLAGNPPAVGGRRRRAGLAGAQ